MKLTNTDIEFYWPHGIEMELQLVNKEGKIISGEEAITDINSMVKVAYSKLCQVLESESTPTSIKAKATSPPVLNANKEKGLVEIKCWQSNPLKDSKGSPIKLTAGIVKAYVLAQQVITEKEKEIYELMCTRNEEQCSFSKIKGVLKALQAKKESLGRMMSRVQLGLASIDNALKRDQRKRLNEKNKK